MRKHKINSDYSPIAANQCEVWVAVEGAVGEVIEMATNLYPTRLGSVDIRNIDIPDCRACTYRHNHRGNCSRYPRQ